MEDRQKWIATVLALAMVVLVGMQSIATAGPGGSLKGKATIMGNEAEDVLATGGYSG